MAAAITTTTTTTTRVDIHSASAGRLLSIPSRLFHYFHSFAADELCVCVCVCTHHPIRRVGRLNGAHVAFILVGVVVPQAAAQPLSENAHIRRRLSSRFYLPLSISAPTPPPPPQSPTFIDVRRRGGGERGEVRGDSHTQTKHFFVGRDNVFQLCWLGECVTTPPA